MNDILQVTAQEQNFKLLKLRAAMQEQAVDVYIVPSGDEFMNEYVPPHARRLEFLTNFTGSAGMAIITLNKAMFFTDGRYMLQAEEELSQNYNIINTANLKPIEWLRSNLDKNAVIGLNPMLFSKDNVTKYQSVATVKLCDDLIDLIWQARPQKPLSVVKIHPLEYSGLSHHQKISQIASFITGQGADLLLLTAPDSICWLLNIRAADVFGTPIVLARLLLQANGTGALFLDLSDKSQPLALHLNPAITIYNLQQLPEFLRKISAKKILLDRFSAPYAFFNMLENNNIIEAGDPCVLPKACKNKVEIQGAYDAHVLDAVAVVSFLCFLEQNYQKQDISEISAAEILLEFRQKNPLFIEPSFNTIAGFASNGAIVHYHATQKSNKKLIKDGIFLLDSGGQYLNGTTDITRTIALGEPKAEQKRNFTLVLKGHIALASAIFPKGTSGHQLDVLARQFLWQHGLDYDHGTGHGVGSFLGVHEGPQRISKAANEVALMPGMIISNEPGYYKNGEYGIRIENLVVVEEFNQEFLCFKTLTLVPIDIKLVDFSLLNEVEKQWLNNYHAAIFAKLSPLVDENVKLWLNKVIPF